MTYIHAPVRVVLQDRNEVRVEIDNSERIVPIPSGAQGLPGEPGFSPVVSVEPITGGNRVTITDADGDTTFDVMNGAQGEQGEPGEGVPTGGVTGQVLKKRTNTDYDTYWANESGGVTSVNGKTGAVILDADDVGALPDDTFIPTKTSDLTNNSGFVDASGASSAAPVQSVNGQTGNVSAVPTGGTAGQILMKSSATDYADEWADISEAGAMSKWTLLWTNASPTSNFAAQTVTVADMSAFDFIAVVHSVTATDLHEDTSFVRRGHDGALSVVAFDGSYVTARGRRFAYSSNTSLAFETGYHFDQRSDKQGASAGDCIPLAIYGIKGVQ